MSKIAILTGVAMSAFALMPLGAAGKGAAAAKAPEDNSERAPVMARGAELMGLISAAGDEGLMLTQDEGLDLVNNGYAQVDTSVTDGNTAKVTLTEAGVAALGASGNTASSYEIEDNIPIPTNTVRRGRTGGYPFEQLAVNQSFHVAAKDDEEPADVAARLQSSVSGARARFAEEIPGETENYTVKTYKKGEDGKFVKDANGKRVVESETQNTRPKTKPTRDFTVKAVSADDPKGAGARVWRTA